MVGLLKGFSEDIICSRDADGTHTNVPRRVVRHSPAGFEWGYGGSGPADFALNILSVFIGQEKAEGLYQDFKWDFIASMPREGGVIPCEAILSWVNGKVQKRNEVKI
jgi:hypothetical protein